MLKRLFWLILAGVGGWLVWQWFRQRQAELTESVPQFAPPRPFERASPPPESAHPAPPASPPVTAQPSATEEHKPADSIAPLDAAEGGHAEVERVPGAAEGAAPDEDEAIAADESGAAIASAPDIEHAEAERVPGAAEGAAPDEDEVIAVDESGAAIASTSEIDRMETAQDAPGEERPPAPDGPAIARPVAASTASESERATIESSAAGELESGPAIEEEVIGYCVRCKTKRPIQDAHEETTESGHRAARGICPVCGANMFTFLKDDESAE